jgi:hypothetical protein
MMLWCEYWKVARTLSCLVSLHCIAVAFVLELEAVARIYVISLYYKCLLLSSERIFLLFKCISIVDPMGLLCQIIATS